MSNYFQLVFNRWTATGSSYPFLLLNLRYKISRGVGDEIYNTSSPFLCNPCSTPLSEFKKNIRRIEMEEFQDFLPIMAEKLGEPDFMAELCKGFRLLADPQLGLITVESLRKNSAILGVESLTDSELQAMVHDGDLDGDGALNEHEFCVLMIRLSPSFMEEAENWLQEALLHELEETLKDCKA